MRRRQQRIRLFPDDCCNYIRQCCSRFHNRSFPADSTKIRDVCLWVRSDSSSNSSRFCISRRRKNRRFRKGRNKGSNRCCSKCCNENCPRNKRFLRSTASFRRIHNNRDKGRSSRRLNILRLNRNNRLKRPQPRRIRRCCTRSRDFPCRLCKKSRKGMFCRLCTRSDMKFR